MKILVVEDQRRMGAFLHQAFAEHAYAASLAESCAQAQEMIAESSYDVVILDLGLPDGDGLDLLREWRENGFNEPVLILSARDAVNDRVAGLNIGADVYLPKPFSFEELLANVRALHRRQASIKKTQIRHGGIMMDLVTRVVELDGEVVNLTSREFAILELFMQSPGRMLSRSYLMEAIWNCNLENDGNLLDVYMSRLRGHFDTATVKRFKTIRGAGYKLI